MADRRKRRVPVATMVVSGSFFLLPFLIAINRTGWSLIVGALLFFILLIAIWRDVMARRAGEAQAHREGVWGGGERG